MPTNLPCDLVVPDTIQELSHHPTDTNDQSDDHTTINLATPQSTIYTLQPTERTGIL